MTYIVARKGRFYRISGILIAEDAGAFIYPSDPYSADFDYDSRIKLNNSPFFILDVDCFINGSSLGQNHEYIKGVVQGYNGICYLSSYNMGWIKEF